MVGYSRAVRTGNLVFVAGTTAAQSDGSVAHPGNPYLQAREIFLAIEAALLKAGAAMTDVVRTRTYVTNIDYWDQVGQAHGEVFGSIRPVATMVEVSRLIHPDMLVEIEVDAVLEQKP